MTQLMDTEPMEPAKSGGAVRLIHAAPPDPRDTSSETAVLRFAELFMERHVRPPYRYERVGARAFTVAGPDEAESFDLWASELQQKLQAHLFGEQCADEVDVLAFAGDKAEVVKFLRDDDAAATKRSDEFLATINKSRSVESDDEENERWTEKYKENTSQAFSYRGVYQAKHEFMLSNTTRPNLSKNGLADVELETFYRSHADCSVDFEAGAFNKAIEYIDLFSGNGVPLHVTTLISYPNLISPRTREKLFACFSNVLSRPVSGLTASIVLGPDNPPSSTVQNIAVALRQTFSYIDWYVSSGSVEPQRFGGVVDSVTLNLEGAGRYRELELQRFLALVPEFKSLKIRPGVTNLSSSSELSQAAKAGVVFASGDAVCRLRPKPVRPMKTPLRLLPTE